MVIESSFIPFPSEIVIPPAAYIAASSGELNIYVVLISGTLGALLGAYINYFLAVYLGRPIIYKVASSRFGALLLLDEHKIIEAEKFMRKYGSISTFTGRLLPGIRQLISIPAGLARVSLKSFTLYTLLGAGLWNIILALIGWYLAELVPMEELNKYVAKYAHEIGIGITLIVVLVLLSVFYRAYRKPKLR